MRIVSFDLSLTATGWCSSDSDIDWGVFLPPKPLRDVARMDWIAKQCAEWARKADLVVMEDFAFAASNSFAREIAGATYMVRHFLWRHDIEYALVAPASLKKFVVGDGGSAKNKVPKSAVMKEVYKRWGHDVMDDNAADAIGLADIGMALTGGWMPTIDAQREVIAALTIKYPALGVA